MGNRLTTIAIYYNDDRSIIDKAVNGGIAHEFIGDTLVYKIPFEFGRFEAMRFIANQNPSNLGGNLFYKVIGTRLASRTVTCAFVNSEDVVQSFASMGPYTSGRDPYTGKYIIQGNMTITFDNPISYKITQPFKYYVPTSTIYSSSNSTIDNNGIIRYNGQLTDNPRLISMEYTTLNDLNNSNSQYALDINLTNKDGNITMTYNNAQCPNITNIVYNSDGLLITSNVPIPSLSLITKLSEASLGITTDMTFYSTNVDEFNTRLNILNNTISNVLKNNTYMTISILILPLISLE